MALNFSDIGMGKILCEQPINHLSEGREEGNNVFNYMTLVLEEGVFSYGIHTNYEYMLQV